MSAARAALHGAALGALAALLTLLPAEIALILARLPEPRDPWTIPTLAAALLGLLLPGALAAGAALGLSTATLTAHPRLNRVRPLLPGIAAAALLAALAGAVLWPAAVEAHATRVALLLAAWTVAWTALRATPLLRHTPLHLRLLTVAAVATLGSLAALAARLDEQPAPRDAIAHHGPLTRPLLLALQRLEDRDNDGFSAWFGGGDCAGLDPRRHPQAPEIADNALDDNCDGHELTRADLIQEAAERLHHALPLPANLPTPQATPTPPDPDATPPQEPPPTSILLITLDTLRPDVVGAFGASPSMTPALDALALRGVVFERTWAQGPLTKASVASLLAGRYFSEVHRTPDAWVKLRPENDTLPERLQRASYATVGVASHPYLAGVNGYDQGFDVLHNVAREGPERSWQADRAAERAIQELRRLDAAPTPFFLWVHLLDPHHPYLPHASLREHAALPLADALHPAADRWERYRAEVFWTDLQLAAILRAADALNPERPLLIAAHADHGEGFGLHGYDYHGQSLFEDQLRVPLILAGRGVTPGRTRAATTLLDLHATLLDAARLPLPPDSTTGAPRSLLPALRGEALPDRPVFAEMVPDDTHSDQKMVVAWPWKLIHSRTHQTWQLYHLERDPEELKNLALSSPRELRRLRRLLERFAQEGLHEQTPAPL